MNFRLYPILIDLIISRIYDCNFIDDPTPASTCRRGISGAFVHHPHTSYVWLKISTVSESTLVTNTNALPNFNLRAVLKLINELLKEVYELYYFEKKLFITQQSISHFSPFFGNNYKSGFTVYYRYKGRGALFSVWKKISVISTTKNGKSNNNP